MATELTDRQNFTKNAILMQIILCLQTEREYGLCKHILASLYLFSKNEKLKIMKLFK